MVSYRFRPSHIPTANSAKEAAETSNRILHGRHAHARPIIPSPGSAIRPSIVGSTTASSITAPGFESDNASSSAYDLGGRAYRSDPHLGQFHTLLWAWSWIDLPSNPQDKHILRESRTGMTEPTRAIDLNIPPVLIGAS